MTRLKAGTLDRRLIIYRMLDTIGGTFGEPIESPMTVETVWASIRHLKGRELESARQISAEITTEFLIRHRTDVNPKYQGVCEGRTYDFLHVAEATEYGRRSATVILAAARND